MQDVASTSKPTSQRDLRKIFERSMASEEGNFYLSGPSYLTPIDWNNSHHRKSIAASLVQGVYTLECDRKQNRQGPQALAPAWFPYPYPNYIGQGPPRYVIAFRGATNKSANRTQDYKLNLQFIVNNLEKSRRFQAGMEAVTNIVHEANGPGNAWLAGHSTGSSIALLIGRNMVKMGIHLDTYLFNPPFASPIELIKNDKLKHGLRLAKSVLTAGLAIAANGGHWPTPHENDPFIMLSRWIPYLFVNPTDPICSEYVGYFEQREKMEKMGAGKIGKISTQHSIGSSIVSSARGKDSEPIHLLPSAYLTINLSPSEGFKEAHGIHQWWKPNLQFNYKLYQHK
ncbi:unnamed protein product [Fraxinus pennsylvanica]|uniref:GDSL esterase/lipase At4g10955-like n=1 Tax=Fraxinus pennsylvanica TaxID=56036 RepID=A0AAD1ZLJ6_9LAMI|nr:unnamed protein product [Fraxinus pennsylvanica]